MKIIEQGKLPIERVLRGKCRSCECVVECTKGEAKSCTQYNEINWYVKCPTGGCNSNIPLDEK